MTATKHQALAHFQANRLTEARAAYTEICSLNDRDADAWFMLGVINGQLGAISEAEQCNRRVVALQPKAFAAWDNLGITLMMQGKAQEAEKCFHRALAINPDAAQVLNHLGNLSREQGNPQQAIQYYRKALKKQPDYAEAYNNLGNIFQDQCQTSRAKEAYAKALEIQPDYLDACFNMGAINQSSGLHEAALGFYRRALQIRPDFIEATAAIADVHEKQGNFEQAADTLKPLLAYKSIPPAAAITYGTLCRRLGRYKEGCDTLEAILRQPIPPIKRQEIIYTLGDLYDERKIYDKAFYYYSQANELRPFHYNPADHTGYIKSLISAFDVSSEATIASAKPTSGRPVFIVGMPRSGTSLVEQILASHSEVYGAGELPYVAELLGTLPSLLGPGKRYPRGIKSFTDRDMELLSGIYLKQLETLSPHARLVTDKMPHNFLHLGLIDRLFPDAHVIHCRRSPMDTCLSIYFHNFNANHPYANNLTHLGEYYRSYEILMEHWQKVLKIPIMEVTYEQLVSDQEKISRSMIEFCGLDWEAQCLDFHETRRPVTTPSYDQVRRPIYTSAIERWRNYATHLTELQKALQEDN